MRKLLLVLVLVVLLQGCVTPTVTVVCTDLRWNLDVVPVPTTLQTPELWRERSKYVATLKLPRMSKCRSK